MAYGPGAAAGPSGAAVAAAIAQAIKASGLIFFAKARIPLDLPARAEAVQAKKIWIPG